MKIMVVAGEASGDLHGAHLVAALRARAPETVFLGMGGVRMEAAGVKLLFNPTTLSTIGFLEPLRHVSVFARVLRRCSEALAQEQPDVLVLIDFAGFNLRLAEVAHKQGIPTVYYISPAVWAWGRKRAARVAATVDLVLSVFSFEVEVYREAGAKVEFIGHPLLDIIPPGLTTQQARAELGVQAESRMVALLPGSRAQEIKTLLNPMLAAALQLQTRHPGLRFFLPLAPTVSAAEVQTRVSRAGVAVEIVSGEKVHTVLAAADAAMVAGGTATLEAAIIGTPMVVTYKVSAATWWLGKRLVKIPHFSLPNIIAGRRIVPELLQDEASGPRIAEEIDSLLTEPERAATMRAALAEVKGKLGAPGAAARAAERILALGRCAHHQGFG